jgi:DNA-binding FadR family transcriptional regulator
MGHHRELTAAMRARAPEWAAVVMRAHIIAARTVLLNVDVMEHRQGET